jgi:hypothetical protein
MYLQEKNVSFIDHKTQSLLTIALRVQCVKILSLGVNLQSASAGLKQHTHILLRVGVTIDGVLDWLLDLLTTYTHHSELQEITAPPLIATIHKSRQHSLSLFQPFVSSTVSPGQRLLTVEILQLHALRSSLHRLPYRTE